MKKEDDEESVVKYLLTGALMLVFAYLISRCAPERPMNDLPYHFYRPNNWMYYINSVDETNSIEDLIKK